MGMPEEVAAFIDSNSTALVLGTSLFINFLADEPNTAAALYETGGIPPSHVMAGTLPAYENPRIQLVTRSTSSATARAIMNTVWRALEGVANQALSGSTYLRISAVQSPFLLERDSRGRTVYAANFDVMRRLS